MESFKDRTERWGERVAVAFLGLATALLTEGLARLGISNQFEVQSRLFLGVTLFFFALGLREGCRSLCLHTQRRRLQPYARPTQWRLHPHTLGWVAICCNLILAVMLWCLYQMPTTWIVQITWSTCLVLASLSVGLLAWAPVASLRSSPQNTLRPETCFVRTSAHRRFEQQTSPSPRSQKAGRSIE